MQSKILNFLKNFLYYYFLINKKPEFKRILISFPKANTKLEPQIIFLIPAPYKETTGKGVLLHSKSDTPNSPFVLLPHDQTNPFSSIAAPNKPPISNYLTFPFV